jgi:hypothetical protein
MSTNYSGAILVDLPRGGLLHTIEHSNAQVVAPIDLLENTLKTIVVPGGIMGPNGFLDIDVVLSCTNNANVKTLSIRNDSDILFNGTLTSSTNFRGTYRLFNRAAEDSQPFVNFPTTAGGWGIGTGAGSVRVIDTAADWNLLINVQKATAADAIRLEHYRVTAHYGAA